MSKIILIIKREYLSRVRKKSFLIMTLLGPLLMALIMVVPLWLAMNSSEEKKIQVIDQSGLFSGALEDGEKIKFLYSQGGFEQAKDNFEESGFDALLLIPSEVNINNAEHIGYYSEHSPGVEVLSFVERRLSDRLLDLKYEEEGLDRKAIEKLKTKVDINTVSLRGDEEKETNSLASTLIGLLSAVLIYMMIFIYGAQIMRGVIEEKTNRIVEVIISSVKPFQLMMGKVVGIGLVGLTQFVIWVILTFGVYTAIGSVFALSRFDDQHLRETLQSNPEIDVDEAMDMNEVMKVIDSINFPLIIFSFVFFFIAGYLFYGALFAAIGSAVDNETDTQQFMLPITIPLILAMVVAEGIMSNPEGSTAFWFSMVPFTSPVVMMIRLPFIGFGWELILSMILLIGGFLGTIWIASRIYRVGILMYGKKVNYKELSRWLFYKNG